MTFSPRQIRLRHLRTLAQRAVVVLLAILIGALGMRAWMSRSAPDLQPWHRMVPAELGADQLRDADWAEYLETEDRLFADVEQEMRKDIDEDDSARLNRYDERSSIHPSNFSHDWNRSFVLEPISEPRGVAVLLHGMTDSPYSMRHLADVYRRRGFIALGLRAPAHGTVPGALTRVSWRDWIAATHLAMREASRRSQGKLPIHIVGYSNGGALAVKYSLDALENPSLARADRLVLLSPMIGVNRHARFAGIAGWPAILPAFARTAWLDILPEMNPFKYNSFPVNAARQSYLLTDSIHRQLARARESGILERLPPIITFQSMVDATVIASAVAQTLYAHLPANGSELVLFDINRNTDIGPFLRSGVLVPPDSMLNPAPRNFRVTIVGNATADSLDVVARSTDAGARNETVEPLSLAWPREVFSLSHIALPFPVSDAVYGMAPDPAEQFGIHLGTLGMRGERGVLLDGLDITTVRISSNPFFSYIETRIDQLLAE